MMNFVIEQFNSKKYVCAIHAASYMNPLHNVKRLEETLQEMHIPSGTILVDLLLANGENFNRFVEADYDGQHLNMNDVRVVEPDAADIKLMNSFYKGKAQLVSGGVLSASQRFQFARGK